jgi:hypothetical protein
VTRGRRAELPDALQKAIADLEIMKARRAAEAEHPAPKKRGRPPKVKVTGETPEPAPSPEPSPAKRGRKARAAPEAERPHFGVGQPTVHRPLGLLEVQEGHDLDALLADPRLAPHIAMRLDERFALVLPASLERLQAALLKVGHTPKLLGGKP